MIQVGSCPLFPFHKSTGTYNIVRRRQKNLASQLSMASSQPPSSGSWPPSKKAAVTLGIILGLVLLVLSIIAFCKLLKLQITRWIKVELMCDRYKHGNHCKCEQPHGHRAYPRRRLSSNSTAPSLSASTLPPVLAPSRPLRDPHYYPRRDAMAPSYYPGSERADPPYLAGESQIDNPYQTRHHGSLRAENPEPISPRGGSELGFSWVAGEERMEYKPPHVTSAPASTEDESPHGTTPRAGRVRSRGGLPIRDV